MSLRLMSLVQSALVLCPAVLSASFLMGYIHPFGEVGLFAEDPPAEMGDTSIPAGVRAVLTTKCGDCHSLETHTPVYAHFAPGSWLIERDIVKARAAMNLSHWDSFSPDQQEGLKTKIAHEVRRDEMPPAQYLALPWNARLTPTDIRAITLWTGQGAGQTTTSSSVAASGAQAQGDADRGKAVFERRCAGCHALTQDREGPHLQGVFGRTAGTVSRFDYSTSLKKAQIVWNEQTLNQWLTDPQAMVPGADMDFYVAKPDERADVIRYLKQLSGK
jgi:cytochrome c